MDSILTFDAKKALVNKEAVLALIFIKTITYCGERDCYINYIQQG